MLPAGKNLQFMQNMKPTEYARQMPGCFPVLALIFTLYACSSPSGEAGGGYQQGPQSLPVVTVSRMSATTYDEYAASIQGTRDIEIRPQVEGYLDKIYVDEGARVRKGQPLFHIDARTYTEQLNTAKAGLATAWANKATAEINVAKIAPLVKNNVVSDIQLKTAQAAYDAAVASVAQAEAMVQSATINLGYTLIRAPVDGYVGRIPLRTGSLVGRTTPTPLTIVSEIDQVYAYFSLSENDFLAFKNDFAGNSIEEKISHMPMVDLLLPDGSNYAHQGKVQLVAGQFDNSTGAISFRAVFPNPDRLLRSGNTGKIRIPHPWDNALVVPQEATFEIQDKVFVFAVGDSNKVVSKPITISGKTSKYYFVGDGVGAGDRIVFAGIGNLRDGMIIIPQPISTDSLFRVKPL